MSGDTPNAGDPFPLSSSRLGGGPIQVPGLKREGLGRLYLTGFAPARPVPCQRFCSLNRRRRFSDLPATMNAPSPR